MVSAWITNQLTCIGVSGGGNAGQSGEWKRPYNLLSIQGESVIIGLPHGLIKFRNTSIKPYFIHSTSIDNHQLVPNSSTTTQAPQTEAPPAEVPPTEAPPAEAPLATLASLASVKHGRGRLRKHLEQANIAFSDICFVMDEFNVFTNKDANAQPPQYTASRQKEIAGLLEKGVFKVVTTEDIPSNSRIFNSRFVDEIKNPGTDKAYEKSRLVVQAYNDKDKNLVLTQSPTIQRVSQRLIVCLASIFQDNDNIKLYLRDITQV